MTDNMTNDAPYREFFLYKISPEALFEVVGKTVPGTKSAVEKFDILGLKLFNPTCVI